jgi:hypothetical protein
MTNSRILATTPTRILGQAPTIRTRPIASISSTTDPLYNITGTSIYSGNNTSYADANALRDINRRDIASLELIKDVATPVIRYAEVVLNMAEAQARTNALATALTLLNTVRDGEFASPATKTYTVATFSTIPLWLAPY